MQVRLLTDQTNDEDGRILQLTVGCVYEVLGIEATDYRLIPDQYRKYGKLDPFLYDFECFEVVDRNEPPFWECTTDEEVRYCYPKEWSRPGFFEDYHDGKFDVRTSFWNDLVRLYPNTWERLKTSGLVSHLSEFNIKDQV